MPTGPEVFLEPPGAWGPQPCTRTHLKKGLVPHLPVWWGGQQIPLDQPLLRVEAFSADWHSCRMVKFLEPQGAFPPGFNPIRRGYVYCLAPEAPFFRGMPTGPEVFFEPPGAWGPRPCIRTHLKKGLVSHLPVWWGGQQKQLDQTLWRAFFFLKVAMHCVQW